MKIMVCVKQVPETASIKFDPVTGTLKRGTAVQVINPHDAYAMEAALRLREQAGEPSTVTVITMGLPTASIMLRECLSMGADEAVLVTDRALAGSDTYATSLALAAAISHCGGADVIFTGQHTVDGDTAHVGPQVAARLGIPQMTGVHSIKLESDGSLSAHCQIEGGVRILKARTPVLLTATNRLDAPRWLNIGGICDAYDQKTITTYDCAQLGIDPAQVGLAGSATQVLRTYPVEWKHQGVTLEGTAGEQSDQLLSLLHKEHLI